MKTFKIYTSGNMLKIDYSVDAVLVKTYTAFRGTSQLSAFATSKGSNVYLHNIHSADSVIGSAIDFDAVDVEFLNSSDVAYATISDLLAGIDSLSGNFNVAGASAIPLSGTETGKPVTGKIRFSYPDDESTYGCLGITLVGGDIIGLSDELELKAVTPDGFAGFDSEDASVNISFDPNFGFTTSKDFSEAGINLLDYAQRAYCEKPQTLINALNNCDSTQLNTIKTILGI